MKKFIYLAVLLLMIFNIEIRSERLNVGVLIYEGVYVLDFTGPIEVFNDTFIKDTIKAFNVFTVSKTTKPIKAHSGLQVIPDYSLDNSPKIDILVIPGGNPILVNADEKYKSWILKANQETKHTISVCTGAFVLANLGLLDGLKATTWHGAKTKLKRNYPNIQISNERWTDNGKILTTSGVSAGIDGSLYLVSKLFGKNIAKNTAEYMDYEYWK